MQEVLGERFDPEPGAVLVLNAQLRLRIAVRSGDQCPESFANLFAVARMDKREKAGADQILVGVAEEPQRRGADVRECQFDVEQRHAAPALFDERSKALLALLEIGLRALPLGDVAHKRGHRLFLAEADGVDEHLDLELLAVRATQRRLQPSRREPAGDDVLQRWEGLSKRVADRVASLEPEDRFRLRIPLDHDAAPVDGHHRVERRCDELLHPRFRTVQSLIAAGALQSFAEKVGGRLEETDFVLLERALRGRVDEQDAECTRRGRDDDAGAAAHAVIVAQMRQLESRLLFEIVERHRRAGQRDVHGDRFVLFVVIAAVREGWIRADRGANLDASRGRDFQRAAMVHAEGHLNERTGLAEENRRIDAGERGLSELGDGDFLAIARLDLLAQTQQLRLARVRRAPDDVKRLLLIGHISVAFRLTPLPGLCS